MGGSAGLMFLHLALIMRKCFVAALSRAAVVVECVGGEEPIVLQVNWDNSCPLLLVFALRVGVPLDQLLERRW